MTPKNPKLDDQPDSPGDAFALVRWMLLALLFIAIVAGMD